jgi:methylmalonyl-CoA mutase
MKKLFESFEKPTILKWKELIQKELKNEHVIDPTAFELSLENFCFQDAYKDGNPIKCQINHSNNWEISSEIKVVNDLQANIKALQVLQLGADTLMFNCVDTQTIEWDKLLKDIHYQYINLYFITRDIYQKEEVLKWFENKEVLQLFVYEQTTTGFDIHALGGNVSQEIAWNLSKGLNLLKSKQKHALFTFGIGSNFLLEISKFRAFQILWDKLVSQFETEITTKICAKTSFLNKSLKDPYTNILRQTTEAFSAALGGVDHILIQPFDAISLEGESDFANRMALNISHILKEEALINQVSDPLSGSYVIEKYTELICDTSWNIFQTIERLGGTDNSNTIQYITDEIQAIRDKRVKNFLVDNNILVGITKFPNPEPSKMEWKENVGNTFGLDHLNLEKLFVSNKLNQTTESK